MDAPIVFAHRGGMAHEPENTLPAFRRSIALGVSGIETDTFVTRDGVVVLHHDPCFGSRWHKQPIATSLKGDLPESIPTLDDLLDLMNPERHLFMDVKGGSIERVVEILDRRRPGPDPRVWLAHSGFNDSDWQLVASWRAVIARGTLVDSTSSARMQGFPARYLDTIVEHGIQCLNMPIADWNQRIVDLCHERGLVTMAFRVHTARRAQKAIRLGLDAMHGNNVDILLAATRGLVSSMPLSTP